MTKILCIPRQSPKKHMVNDLKVTLDNYLGTLADLSEALGVAGVNIEGIFGFAREVREGEDSEFVIHILVENAAATKKTLKSMGTGVKEERACVK